MKKLIATLLALLFAVALILAYAQSIVNLVQFQSNQAVIRYGAIHAEDGRHEAHHEREHRGEERLAKHQGQEVR